jgi:hypothetical protein
VLVEERQCARSIARVERRDPAANEARLGFQRRRRQGRERRGRAGGHVGRRDRDHFGHHQRGRCSELLPRETEARIDGVEGNPDRTRDVGRTHLLDLGEDEDFALVVVERVEKMVDQARGLFLRRELVGSCCGVHQRFGIRAGLRT